MRAWLVVAAALSVLAASAQTMRDDFGGYAAGSDAAPGWESLAVGWEVQNNGYVSDGGTSLWRAVPYGAVVTFACDVTVLELLKGDWLTAGIGLYASPTNYWAVNFVVKPEAQGRGHFCEFQEMLEGAWLAQGAEGSRLPGTGGAGGDFNWQLNKPYRFEITLAEQDITARILDQQKEVFKSGFRFVDKVPAVRAGRPGVRCAGARARFDNAEVTVTKPAEEPAEARPAIPAWAPRPGQPIVQGTGFFRAVEHDGRWWLVDPEGKPFFITGTDHVNYRAHWCEKLGYAPYHRNVAAKYGSEEVWAKQATDRLKQWGFNTVAAGHSPSVRHRGLAHILFGSFASSFAPREWICEPIHWTGFADVFSPRWPRHCQLLARQMARESRGDPWCLGIFLDNELEWYGKHGSLVDEVFRRPATQPAKKALWAWLLTRYGDLRTMNAKLGTKYAGEQAFLEATDLLPASEEAAAVRNGFLAQIAEKYFSVAYQAMKEADPDHLVMGARFAGRCPEPVLAAAGKWSDVYTINTYPRVSFEDAWGLGLGGTVEGVPRQLVEYYQIVRKPMIITEWSFPALDSGLPCKYGAGMRVDTQEQKAACYAIFANQIADLPFMVGYHYFMWADEPAEGISSTFPEDSNYGLVNVRDEPYETLTRVATQINNGAFERHAKSFAPGPLEVQTADGGLALRNPGQTPARGYVRISAGEVSKVTEVILDGGATRQVPAPPGQLWVGEVQQWDGTKRRLVGGRVPGALEVVNVGAAELAGVPVVLERQKVATAWLNRLQPGRSQNLTVPAAELSAVPRLDLASDGVTWRCDRRNGSLFDTISADGLNLGWLVFAVHQQIGGGDQWVETDRVQSLKMVEQPDAWVIEAEVERVSAGGAITAVDAEGKPRPAPTGPGSYKAAVRAVVFKRGGIALVRPLWVENTDSRPWRLVDAFWFCRPSIGGSSQDDLQGGAEVPMYYLSAQFWTDAKLGGAFGAVGGDGWQVSFFRNPAGGFHPDARYAVGRDLKQGERWLAERLPYLWVFGAKEAKSWRSIATRRQAASQGLLAAP